MNWYYLEGGNRVGPVDEAEFGELVGAGRIRAETLVWCEGMTEWRPYGELGASAAQVSAGAATAACAECGRTFSTESMIRHGGVWVCAQCKPAFLQKLREGVTVRTGEFRYGGFWMRFVASFVDGLFLGFVNFALELAATPGIQRRTADPETAYEDLAISAIVFLLQFLVSLFYETWMVGKFGATLGKMACGLRVVVADGSKVSYLRAFGRYFAKIVSALILCIGYIMAAFDVEKRALHDRMCDTRVIYR